MKRLWRWLREPEIIGAPDCPLMLRWTLVDFKAPTVNRVTEGKSQGRTESLIVLPKWLTGDRKLMVHHFLPNVEDRDPHNHPRAFYTLVLWGRYYDLVPCKWCDGTGVEDRARPVEACLRCNGEGTVVGDVMKAGTFRYRPAQHTHITQSGPRGAWTVVVMTTLAGKWGFFRAGRFWPWKDYEAKFGFAHHCPTEEEMEGVMLKYTDEGVVPKDSL